MCCKQRSGLSRLGFLLGLLALATLLVAFVGGSWLYTREPLPLEKVALKTTISFRIGLWRVCPTVKRINNTIRVKSLWIIIIVCLAHQFVDALEFIDPKNKDSLLDGLACHAFPGKRIGSFVIILGVQVISKGTNVDSSSKMEAKSLDTLSILIYLISVDVPSPACSLVKYAGWQDILHSDLGISWTQLDLAQVFITRMRSCTVLCSAAVILLILAVFFGLLGHCNNDNKTIIACGLFILGGLCLGCGLITFASALSATLAEIYEFYKDGPLGPDYDYRYGWCFFTASVALILTYISSALSFVGYLNRYSSIDDMVREMVPGADRKLREHQLSTEYHIRHTNPHPPPRQQYDTLTRDQQIPLEQYEVAECGPLLNKTPPDVCTTNRCQEFAAASDLPNAGALEINFCSAGASCNAHSQALVGQTIPITIKNHNSTAPLSFSNLPASKFGTLPHGGTTLHQGFLGVSDMGSSSSNSSSGYCGKSKTLQHQRAGSKLPVKKCVKIETFQVPEANFEGFGKQRPNSTLGYSGSAV